HLAGVESAHGSLPPAANQVGSTTTDDGDRVPPVEQDWLAGDAGRELLVDHQCQELGLTQVQLHVWLDDGRAVRRGYGGVASRNAVVEQRVPRSVVLVVLDDLGDVRLEVQSSLGAAHPVAQRIALFVGGDLNVQEVGQTDLHL